VSNGTGGALLEAGPASTRDRAIAAEQKHKELLDKLTPEVLKSDEAIRDIRGDILSTARDYMTSELRIFGVAYPMDLDPTNPEHAIAKAVWADFHDSDRQLTNTLNQRSEERYWSKQPQSFGEALAVGLGASIDAARAAGKDIGDKIKSLFDNPLALIGIVVGVVGIFLTVLLILKG
jgi:hypothetical protein